MTLIAIDPRSGDPVGEYEPTTASTVEQMLADAAAAAGDPALACADRRTAALNGAARRLRAQATAITATAEQETGLPPARLAGELERTCVQLELFAAMISAGQHYEAIIDHADPDWRPLPRPDLRRMQIPIGPVLVFGASNFPLAFSTAGGDTASALAAGCPVIVKGHPSHPGTGALVAHELTGAIEEAGLPKGSFAYALGSGIELGQRLAADERISAIAFTGSLTGGSALSRIAAARPRPIPVFAEMGSVNPLILTQGALSTRADEIAAGLASSVSTFGGQLCTKPGVIFIPAGDEGERFAAAVAHALDARAPEVLLNAGIAAAFNASIDALNSAAGATRLTIAPTHDEPGHRARPVLFATAARVLAQRPDLREEHFGPAVVVATYVDRHELELGLRSLGGQLTATIHSQPEEHDPLAWLVGLCADLAGRVIFDGYPTGVAVTWAMQHGGPYPASTAPESTSVGMTALGRFMRPVVYQDAPPELLHPALVDANPLGLWRRIDGVLRGPDVDSPCRPEPA
jgi:2,5-dioxopentanoate dehydrogenase